eukprot:UN00005
MLQKDWTLQSNNVQLYLSLKHKTNLLQLTVQEPKTVGK